jgi:hypothetical protein
MPGVAQVLAIGVLLAAAGLVVRGLLPDRSDDFVVDFDGTDIATKGRFPSWLAADLTRLLKDEMRIRPTRIRGHWQGRVLKVHIEAKTPTGDAQRIRTS